MRCGRACCKGRRPGRWYRERDERFGAEQIESRIVTCKREKPHWGARKIRELWWLRLGIQIERIRPGRPQQNGRHERMHLTLKKEATRPPGMNMSATSAKRSWIGFHRTNRNNRTEQRKRT